jgi:alkylation response protein AidB-like acyl-CoA dehydrogenase
VHSVTQEEYHLLVQAAHDLLSRRAPLETLSEREASHDGHDRALWREMADLGWTGLLIEDVHGGVNGNHASLGLLSEEMGRVLLPSPFLAAAAAARALGVIGSDLAAEQLQGLAEGTSISVLAVGEGDWTALPETVFVNGRVTGRKRFIDGACDADTLLVTAQNGNGSIRLVRVDVGDDGVSVTPTMAMVRGIWGDAEFRDVQGVDLGDANAAVTSAVATAAVAVSAWCAGAIDQLLWDTVRYVSERRQFGVPIGSFQSVQHSLVDCSIAAAESLTLARHAATLLDAADMSYRRLTSTAFVHATRSFVSGTRRCHQAWGGMGFSTDALVHHFSRRAKMVQHSWGGPSYHLEIVAEEIENAPLLRDRYFPPNAGLIP